MYLAIDQNSMKQCQDPIRIRDSQVYSLLIMTECDTASSQGGGLKSYLIICCVDL